LKLTQVITSLGGGHRFSAALASALRRPSSLAAARRVARQGFALRRKEVLAAAQADLIVLGAIPRLLGRRMFLGNTVEFVLHHAACAVALFIPAARRAGTA